MPTDFKKEAAQAVEQEEKAKAVKDVGSYTHTLKKPFTREGKAVEKLHFDWESLTGGDYNAIESDLLRRGVTLVVPEYTGEFLEGMAVRACTDRDERGNRILDNTFLEALPIKEYKKILGRARAFLLQ